ncbi:MAG: hypothetical protein LC118_00110 [Dehalococcoidia bacterium]|nr:hypothetical protein [Dehalococcoidia bacterium]
MSVALTQLSRIYGMSFESAGAAGAAIASDPATLANALFGEAVDSDDVTSIESARDYLQGRIVFLSGCIPETALEPIRAAFEARLEAWA